MDSAQQASTTDATEHTSTTPTTCTGKDALRLEDFLGEWRDSMGHHVSVRWSLPGNRAGELDVELLRGSSGRGAIRLNVKSLGEGRFLCGHFELKLGESSAEKIVWDNMRNQGKVSVWERSTEQDSHRRRSRSPRQRQQNCGCVCTGRVALRCVDHVPRSVLHDISTPGAWAPPATHTEALEKPSEEVVEKPVVETPTLEEYDQTLTLAEAASVSQQSQDSPEYKLNEARKQLLAKHFRKSSTDEPEEKLVPDTPSKTRIATKDRARDPRIRRSVVAPTGGA